MPESGAVEPSERRDLLRCLRAPGRRIESGITPRHEVTDPAHGCDVLLHATGSPAPRDA
jgi:hypothetical protein